MRRRCRFFAPVKSATASDAGISLIRGCGVSAAKLGLVRFDVVDRGLNGSDFFGFFVGNFAA